MTKNIKELTKQAKAVIDKIIYITLATSSNKGEPWNSPVYTSFDKNYNFYWLSWNKNQHSKNIIENGRVFAVIYDTTAPEGTGYGIYMKGKAKQLEKKDIIEIIKALKLHYQRKKKKPRSTKEFLGVFPRRVFKFTPEKIWVTSESDIKGNYIDTRKDITKEFFRK
ncbi:MAG: pyridoxamine 5'-phosphate oxidase family protein [Candidatus Aenigmatarchaeota archaeon]